MAVTNWFVDENMKIGKNLLFVIRMKIIKSQ